MLGMTLLVAVCIARLLDGETLEFCWPESDCGNLGDLMGLGNLGFTVNGGLSDSDLCGNCCAVGGKEFPLISCPHLGLGVCFRLCNLVAGLACFGCGGLGTEQQNSGCLEAVSQIVAAMWLCRVGCD